MILIKRKSQFLKDVFVFTFIAFGGPQAHIAMMLRNFVAKKKYITEEELVEYNALCQLLPGPSSTQTLVAIAYKFGGLKLAILSFFIWVLPSACIMTLFAVFFPYSYFNKKPQLLILFNPIAIGFVAYSAYVLASKVVKTHISYTLVAFAIVITMLFPNAYAFPIVIAVGILFSIVFIKTDNTGTQSQPAFNLEKLLWFLIILLFFALLGAIVNRTSFFSLPIRLFENFYRNGIMIFGGGQVLVPLLYTEFVEMKQYLSAQEFLSGYTLQQALPGPVFSFTSFVGGMAMRNGGVIGQLLGSTAALMGINLPGLLFILTLFPLWENLKQKLFIKRILVGINSVSVGFVVAAFFLMIKPVGFDLLTLSTILITFLLLVFTRVSPLIIIGLGLFIGYLL